MTEEQVHLGVLTFLRTCLPSAAAAVAPWSERAKSRLAMERALAALHIHAVSSLSGSVKE